MEIHKILKTGLILSLLFLLFASLAATQSSYTNWNSGEPNDAGDGEHCAETNYQGDNWNDIPCDNNHVGLCEYPDGSYDTTSSTTWNSAKNTCENRGGYLAIVNDDTENQYIYNNFNNVWIGYYQPNGGSVSDPADGWEWVDTSASFDAEISGPSEVDSGSVAQFFGTVENTGSLSGSPGILTIENEGDDGDESWNAGELDSGETFEEGRFVSFGSAGNYELCTELSETSASDCMTVTVTDSSGSEGWKNLMNFELDLTGPDSGIGWDENDGAPLDIELRDNRRVVFTDIYWQDTFDGGDFLDEHEPRMCGDDQREYLLEEMGESTNPEKFTGRYACADDYQYCVYRGTSGEKIFERADSDDSRPVNTEEPGEDEGRLKNDAEICAQRPGLKSTSMDRDYDPVPQWYDQDYANSIEGSGSINVPYQNVCQENSLYGQLGVRWMDKDYIQSHPHAVTGGIDDSWNPRLEQMGHPSLESRPDQDSYGNVIDNGVTPVDTGTLNTKVAHTTSMNYGFCAGDDASEYLVHQKSQTRFVETDNNILGAAESPNSCVLENSQLDNSEDGGKRSIYEEGERVEFDVGDGSRQQIACYGGAWWGDWPVVFLEDEVTASLGETRYSSFRVINPEDSSREFDLSLNIGDDQLDQLTTFASTNSNEMNTTLEGQSSRTFDIEIRANREISQNQIELQGESRRGDLEGFDQLQAEIVDNGGTVGNTQGQVRDVPGLTLIQIIVMSLIGTTAYYFTS